MTGTLTFNNIEFYGYHGLYNEESIIGTKFIIHIKAVLKADFNTEVPTLTNSVNYEALFLLVQNTFAQREPLIESVVLNIYKALKNEFTQVKHWSVSMEKQNPLGQFHFNPCFTIDTNGIE